MIKKISLSLIILLLSAGIAYAHFGVALSGPFNIFMGKVKPHRIYNVVIFNVGNPGDAIGCYKMNVSHRFQQPENIVPRDWIEYTPETFCLEPGDWQRVVTNMYINPETKIDKGLSGDYFSFLEACTFQGAFGACAASKLHFTIGGK